MIKRTIIRKFLILAAWFVIISGLATLLIAANRKEKEHVCQNVLISILGPDGDFYVQKEDILKQMIRTAQNNLLRHPVSSLNLGKLEKAVEINPWIQKAELFFDSKDMLHVQIIERFPVARVFTKANNSFYFDSSGQRMPLIQYFTARVPVITGFTDDRKLNSKDSELVKSIKALSLYLYSNDFWNAQIGQIAITEDSKFELIPVVGDHIIKIGDASGIGDKLNRLYIFYKQIMTKVGFNKYSALDLQFDGQVVAIKKDPTSIIDSLQLKRNIEELMNKENLENPNKSMWPDESKFGSFNPEVLSANRSTGLKPNSIAFDPAISRQLRLNVREVKHPKMGKLIITNPANLKIIKSENG
ncbi:MAG: hypothetical protein NVS1B13_01690 [Flavisolibacter sp.]